MHDLQEKVKQTYDSVFGKTSLSQRLKIIFDEACEIKNFTDIKNLKEETGDLMSALIQLCSECDWDIEQILKDNLTKILNRKQQYSLLKKKIPAVIIGGAFDPIHMGHLYLAKFLLNTQQFEEVHIMPCYQHMYGKKMASPEHRLEMCRLATQDDGRIHVSDFEIARKLSGETYNMVSHLLEEDFAKNEYDFSLVIGMDNANTFDKWVNYQDLERMIRFVVVNRQGIERDPKVNWYMKPPHLFFDTSCEAPGTIPAYSSTEIKQYISGQKQSNNHIRVALNRKVLEYIGDNGLYDYSYILDPNLLRENTNIPVPPKNAE